MVGFSLSGDRRPGGGLGEEMMSMAAFELSQAVGVPGKLRGLREASRGEIRVLEAQLAAARRELAAEIRGAYARLFAIDRETEAARAAGGLLDLLAASAAARYAAGEGDLAEPALARLEGVRLAGRLDDLSAEREEVRARLNGLIGRPAATPIRTTASLPDPEAPLAGPRPVAADGDRAALAAEAADSSAEVRMRRAEVEAARRRVRAARLARWPDLTFGAEYGHRGRQDPAVTARVGVELPVWKGNKQDADLRAAEHDLRAREADLRASRARVQAEADGLLSRLLVADRQLRRYREEILPQADLIAEARRAAYATGRGGLGRLVEALRMRLEAASESARREADRFDAWARWQAIAGLRDDTAPGSGSAGAPAAPSGNSVPEEER